MKNLSNFFLDYLYIVDVNPKRLSLYKMKKPPETEGFGH